MATAKSRKRKRVDAEYIRNVAHASEFKLVRLLGVSLICCIILCSDATLADCTADGGKLTLPQDCVDSYLIKGKLKVGDTDIVVSETFTGCAPIDDEALRPVEIQLDEDGNVNGTTGTVYEPSSTDFPKDSFCLAGGSVYSTYEDDFRPSWGYCFCDNMVPTTAPNVLTEAPSNTPSNVPSSFPSLAPSDIPSSAPSNSPSLRPITSPSKSPSKMPSSSPTVEPMTNVAPSTSPLIKPSAAPSAAPIAVPSDMPSATPNAAPSTSPLNKPSAAPSAAPNRSSPTPTRAETQSPTLSPVASPTQSPSKSPSAPPSAPPSRRPSNAPITSEPTTAAPSMSPTEKACITDGGHKVSRDCTFPFVYKGETYNDCISFSDNSVQWPYMDEDPLLEDSFETDQSWCAIVSEYSNTKKATRKLWGTCDCSSGLETCSVDGVHNGNESDIDCGGPACEPCDLNSTCIDVSDCKGDALCLDEGACGSISGVVYRERISVSANLLQVSASAWSFVGSLLTERLVNSTGAIAEQVEVTVDLYKATNSPNCTTEGGWVPDASDCTLPFSYNGSTYDQCIDVQNDATPYFGNESTLPPGTPPSLYLVHWCPTVYAYDSSDIAVREKWGYCDCNDMWPTHAPTPAPTPILGDGVPPWCGDAVSRWNMTNMILDHLWVSTNFATSLEGFRVYGDTGHELPYYVVDKRSESEGAAIEIMLQFSFGQEEKKNMTRAQVAQAILDPVYAALDPYVNGTNGKPTECTPSPTSKPTMGPSRVPTLFGQPSTSPSTGTPTQSPSRPLKGGPTPTPTQAPSFSPSKLPTTSPSFSPSKLPTTSPSFSPSKLPTTSPSFSPSKLPTTLSPTASPTSSAELANLIQSALYNTNTTGVGFVDHPGCEKWIIQLFIESNDDLLDCKSDPESCSCLKKILDMGSRLSVICLGRLDATLSTRPDLTQNCGW